jgi:hypothetical protein
MTWHLDFLSFWVGLVMAFAWVVGVTLFIRAVKGWFGRRR